VELTFDLAPARAQVASLVASLPAAAFNESEAVQRTQLEDAYGGGWGWSFSPEFDARIASANAELAKLDPATNPGIILSLSYANVADFTPSYVSGNDYSTRLLTATGSADSYDALAAAVADMDGYSADVAAAANVNADVVGRLDTLGASLASLNTTVADAAAGQASLIGRLDSASSAVDAAAAGVSAATDALDGVLAGVDAAVALVASADRYTKCGWISAAYDSLIRVWALRIGRSCQPPYRTPARPPA
jgi:hypothetical protein